MGSSVTQRILSFQLSRRLTIAIAGLVLLGALAGSAARPPEASAQCIFCSQWGYNYGGYSPWGYNRFNNFNYGNYGNYGLNYGYNSGLYSGLYGYNSGLYGYNSGLYGYNNNCSLGGGYYGGFGNCGSYTSGYNYGYSYPGLYGYNNYAYSNPVYYNAGTTYATTSTVPATVVSTYSASPVYAISGMYCKDKSGGAIWQPAGAPPDPTLTCGGTTATGTSGAAYP